MANSLNSMLVSWVLGAVLWMATPVMVQAANRYVVIAADPLSEALPLGKVLKVNDRIDVAEGMVVTLLGDDGTVTTVRGPQRLLVTAEPVDASPNAARDRTTFDRVSGLLLGNTADAEALGVTRSIRQGGGNGSSLDPWSVSIHRSGPACVQRGRIVLSREKSFDEVPLAVTAGHGLTAENFVWPKGARVFELPQHLAGQAEELTIRAGATESAVQLHRLPDGVDPKGVMEVIGWMLDQNCRAQALLFARSLGQ